MLRLWVEKKVRNHTFDFEFFNFFLYFIGVIYNKRMGEMVSYMRQVLPMIRLT